MSSELEWNDNDAARQEARPSFGIFRGRYAVLVVAGALCFLMLFKILSSWGVDFGPTIVLSLLPMGLFTLWVATCVNGKAPSHTFDLMLLGRFVFRCWMFRHGIIQRAPALNIRVPAPPHPSEFNR
jgi:hypothetical protein